MSEVSLNVRNKPLLVREILKYDYDIYENYKKLMQTEYAATLVKKLITDHTTRKEGIICKINSQHISE